MKKRILKTAALVLAVATCMVAIGCNPQNGNTVDATKVYLKALPDATAVATGTVKADYYLLAEPAVSAQSKNGFSIKGDLQELYGGEQGYPQAVLVAKTELTENYVDWLEVFTQSLTPAAEWLSTATGEQIVAAVNGHMDDEATATTLKAPLLNASVTGRCGVWFSYAKDSQTEINGFLQKVLAVNDKATAIPNANFYWQGGAGALAQATTLGREITVCMPDGAPALAMAKLMSEDTAEDGVTYKVVDPKRIASKVTNNEQEKNADLCVLPLTAASKLLGQGNGYKLLGVVTHGNLYLISKDGEALTKDSISTLKGKTIGVLQINEVPGLTLKTVLNEYKIPFEEVKNT